MVGVAWPPVLVVVPVVVVSPHAARTRLAAIATPDHHVARALTCPTLPVTAAPVVSGVEVRRLLAAMSTRKLILLALLCGLAILVAGGVKLLQVAGDEPTVAVLAPGSAARVGDVVATVHGIERVDQVVLVDVELAGWVGGDPTSGWIMLADGERREPVTLPPGVGVGCVDASNVRCTVAFPVAERVQAVAYARGGEQRQWVTRTSQP